SSVFGDSAVRTLYRHTGPGGQLSDGLREVAELFDRDSDERWSWQCRDGVRMGLPPQVGGEEAPLEELTSDDGHSLEVLSSADYRHDSFALPAHLDDAETVICG